MNKLTSIIFLFFFVVSNAQVFDNPEGLFFDEANGNYYVSNTRTGQIVKINSNGEKSNLGYRNLGSHGIEMWNGNLLACFGNTLNIIDAEKGHKIKGIEFQQAKFLKDITKIDDGCYLLTDFSEKKIFKLRLGENGNYEISEWLNVGAVPTGIYSDEKYVYYTIWGAEGAISRVNKKNKAIENVFVTEYSNLLDITSDGEYLYVSVWKQNDVIKFKKDFSTEPSVIENAKILHPGGLHFNKNKNELVMTDLGLNRFNPSGNEKKEEPSFVSLELNAFPNPVAYNTRISYHLDSGGEVIFQLFNCKGQLIKTVRRQIEQAGNNQFILEKENLSDGLYFLHASSENMSEAIPITFVR